MKKFKVGFTQYGVAEVQAKNQSEAETKAEKLAKDAVTQDGIIMWMDEITVDAIELED